MTHHTSQLCVCGRPQPYVRGHNRRTPQTVAGPPTTGHPLCDQLLPAALQLVGAVRDGSPRAITDAVAAAREAAAGHPHWRLAWCATLAALVPDDQRPSELLAWCRADEPGRAS